MRSLDRPASASESTGWLDYDFSGHPCYFLSSRCPGSFKMGCQVRMRLRLETSISLLEGRDENANPLVATLEYFRASTPKEWLSFNAVAMIKVHRVGCGGAWSSQGNHCRQYAMCTAGHVLNSVLSTSPFLGTQVGTVRQNGEIVCAWSGWDIDCRALKKDSSSDWLYMLSEAPFSSLRSCFYPGI